LLQSSNVSSAGLKAADRTADSPDPPGRRYFGLPAKLTDGGSG
jgi:hypothetical protein